MSSIRNAIRKLGRRGDAKSSGTSRSTSPAPISALQKDPTTLPMPHPASFQAPRDAVASSSNSALLSSTSQSSLVPASHASTINISKPPTPLQIIKSSPSRWIPTIHLLSCRISSKFYRISSWVDAMLCTTWMIWDRHDLLSSSTNQRIARARTRHLKLPFKRSLRNLRYQNAKNF